jgi:DNA-binding response OmpR family regulator
MNRAGNRMSDAKILVVDDDKKIVDLVSLYLKKDGYRVLSACDGGEAIDLARSKRPDLVVLDLMLPHVDGLDVCRIIRAESAVPIIMLTGRTTDSDKLAGLDIGADDYVTKPFNPKELLARIRAVLRRTSGRDSGPSEVRFGEVVLDYVRHEVRVSGQAVNLTPTEFNLLQVMVKDPGRAFSRVELLERVFGYDYEGLERTVDVHVMNLRKKIEPEPASPQYVVTVPGLGYRFEAADVA